MHWTIRLPLYLFVGYLAVCGLVWIFQRKMQYFPYTENPSLPAGANYADLENVTVRTPDGIDLQAWWWPGSRPETLLVFHGNAGHRGHRAEWMEPFHLLGWSILLTDYRGYGGSGGSPTEEGLFLDADAYLDWLEERGVARVALLGESIGCSVAVDLASRRNVSALVLQSGALSIRAVAQGHYPFLPVGPLMKDRYESAEKVPKIRAPFFCMHGAADRIVPIEHGRALFDLADEPKEWWVVEGAGHNDISLVPGREYYARIHAFLERSLTAR